MNMQQYQLSRLMFKCLIEVEFKYRQKNLIIGAWLCAAGLLMLAAVIFFDRRWQEKHPPFAETVYMTERGAAGEEDEVSADGESGGEGGGNVDSENGNETDGEAEGEPIVDDKTMD